MRVRLPYLTGRARFVLAALVLGLLDAAGVARADTPLLLDPGQPLERTLAPGATHRYHVVATAGQYFRVALEPSGIVPTLSVTDPGGHVRETVRDAGDADDPVAVSVLADTAGHYQVQVTADTRGASGRYRLVLETLRPAVDHDRTRVTAQHGQIEAGRLSNKGTADGREKALEAYEASRALWQSLGDARGESHVLNEMGVAHFTLGNSTAALDCWRKAQSLSVSVQDRRGEAQALGNLGLVASVAGDQPAALAAYERALTLSRELGARRQEAWVLHNIGTAQRNQGDPAKALEYYEQALALARELKDERSQANTLIGMGNAYSLLGEQHRALEACERALPLARASGDRGLEASVLERLAERLITIGDIAQARRTLESALSLSRRAGDGFREANALSVLGAALNMDGDYAAATTALTRAIALRTAQGDRSSPAGLLVQLGMAARLMGDRSLSEERLRQAIASFSERGDPAGEAYAHLELGLLHQDRGELGPAAESESRALTLSRAAGDVHGEAMSLYRLAQVQRAQGDLDAARQSAQDAVARIESLRARISGPPWRLAYFVTAQDLHEFYIDLLMQLDAARPGQGFAARAFEASEAKRARGLMDVLASMRMEATLGTAPEQRKAEAALRGRLGARLRQQMQLLAASRPAVGEAERLAKEIEALLADYERMQRGAGGSPGLQAEARPAALTDIQAHLDDGTTLIEFSLGEPASYGWAVTRDGVFGARLPSRRELTTAARAFYDRVSRAPTARGTRSPPTRAAAAALSRQLLGPFQDHLRARRLLVVPDGILHYVPFAALPVGAEGETMPLLVDHVIVALPSASAAVLLGSAPRHSETGKTVAVFADPVFERDDPRLQQGRPAPPAAQTPTGTVRTRGAAEGRTGPPGELPRLAFSRREADAISTLAPAGSVLRAVGFEASRRTALATDLGAYRVLHFATHGLLDDDHPELSGIALSLYDRQGRRRQDGFLRLEDIYEMRLPVELVVLSACRTALGKDVRGEGLTGLVRAFMHAGAARVIATQWSVDDRATSVLMREFYRSLLVARREPAEALRDAQMRVRANPAWRDQYYWAGFVLSGAWP
jgi:CHAT domain-containing protein/tetratricopeptide (TPR) repeat protein